MHSLISSKCLVYILICKQVLFTVTFGTKDTLYAYGVSWRIIDVSLLRCPSVLSLTVSCNSEFVPTIFF